MSLFRVPLCSCTISFGEFVCSRVIWCPALVGNGESVLSVKIAERTYKIRQERKHYAAEKKVSILRRHLLDEVAVSDLCEELPAIEGLLPLAQRVHRERSGRLSNEGTSSPRVAGEAETD
jgi:hypothetical protein